jgi:hypothetical protein
VAIDGSALAGIIALPAQVTAWHEKHLTSVAPLARDGVGYTCTPSANAPPKEVLPTDLGLTCEGKEQVVVWYDPTTLVPDKIEIPSQRLTLMQSRGKGK